jgi:hypothetical protein
MANFALSYKRGMSIQIEATYSKKLGLPNFSSHSFMISVRAEVSSLRRLETESARLYRVLQTSVDKEVQQVGFLPDATRYGMLMDGKTVQNGSSKNGHGASVFSASITDAPQPSDKQKALIEKVAKREKFTADDLNGIAQRLFKLPLEQLDRKQTSAFITELLMIAGPPRFRRAAVRPAAVANGEAA